MGAWLRAYGPDLFGMGGPALLLVVLATHNLGATSFWRDEISSVVFAHAGLGDLLTILGRDRSVAGLPNMSAYILVLHFWLAVGETEARVRLLSVLAGAATVVPIYLTARRVGGWTAGILAGAVFAIIPYVVHYSQDARGYSMAMLAAASLTWLVIKATERQTTIWWLVYGLVAALSLYVHFFVALVIAVHAVWVLATRQLPAWRGLLAWILPIAIAAAPIPIIVTQYGGIHGWIDVLTLRRMWLSLAVLAGGWAALLTFGVALAWVLVVHRRNRLVWLLVGVVLLPIAITAAVSTVKPLFVPRYLIVVLPAMAVITGIAIASLRPRILGVVAAAAVGAVLITALPTAYPALDRQDWRSAARWIVQEREPDDRFLVPVNGRRQLEYYLDRNGMSLPPSEDVADIVGDPQGTRVWVLASDQTNQNIEEELAGVYRLVDQRSWGRRIHLLLFEPVADSPPA